MNEFLTRSTYPQLQQTILLVDDRTETLDNLEAALDDGHLVLLKAASGADALRLLREHDVSLVVLDVEMPDMNGYEVARLMQASAKTSAIPILFITASAPDEKATIRAYQAGAVDFLMKPFSTSLLQSKVSVFLKLDQSTRNLQQAYARLDNAKAYYESMLNAAGEGVLGMDPDGRIRFSNPAALHMLACSAPELVGKNFHDIYAGIDSPDAPEPAPGLDGWRSVTETRIDEAYFRTCGGARFPVSLCCSPLPGKMAGTVVVFQDITARRALEQRLRMQAVTDHLTGLSNRNGFKSALRAAIARARRRGESVALMFIDLDHFKRINDTLGHDVGDHLLNAVALRLKECVRSYDIVSRIGGDEFTVVLGELGDIADAALVARKILAALHEPFCLKTGMEITISASIGISGFPECGDEIDTLMQAADVAMYQAKSDGRNLYQFYLPAMNAKARSKLVLEQALRVAVKEDEFFLHYQPQIDLVSGKVVGFEALLRWHHLVIGNVSPSTFVPMLEETGLIIPAGHWVFSTSCRQRHLWNEMLHEQCSISVNLSPRQFTDKNLVNQIRHVLEINDLQPYQLEIEVTEGMLMRDTQYTQDVLRDLKRIGLKLSIDDFGTGYSSLAYLKQFTLDSLKIDKQFIDNLTTSKKDAAIATSIIQLAHNLGMQVIAEGVETAAQANLLQELGCDVVQGFYFGRPISARDVEKFPHELTVNATGAVTPS
jgi:diguanylate cyclase (GGDEF)-like protein/PAS domain S-box-containing protein